MKTDIGISIEEDQNKGVNLILIEYGKIVGSAEQVQNDQLIQDIHSYHGCHGQSCVSGDGRIGLIDRFEYPVEQYCQYNLQKEDK